MAKSLCSNARDWKVFTEGMSRKWNLSGMGKTWPSELYQCTKMYGVFFPFSEADWCVPTIRYWSRWLDSSVLWAVSFHGLQHRMTLIPRNCTLALHRLELPNHAVLNKMYYNGYNVTFLHFVCWSSPSESVLELVFILYDCTIRPSLLTVVQKAQNLDLTGAMSNLTFYHISCMEKKMTL